MSHQQSTREQDLCEMLDKSFDLAQYLKALTLQPLAYTTYTPKVPPRTTRSAVLPLSIKPGGYRQLQVTRIMRWLEKEVDSFFRDLALQLGDACAAFRTIPLSSQVSAETMMETYHYNPYLIGSRRELVFAVEQGPLWTVQTLVHKFEPDLEGWKFHTPRNDETVNIQGIEPIFWASLNESGDLEYVRCIVIPLAPWEFTPKDFDDFTNMGDFTDGHQSMNGERSSASWTNAGKLWAYLHDLCAIHDCRHFVVTTYEQWSFGGFSTYFSTSMASRVKSWDDRPGNSVLEMLTYWMLSACRFEGTVVLHEDPLESDIDLNELEGFQMHNECPIASGPLRSRQDIAIQGKRSNQTDDGTCWEPLQKHLSRATPPFADEGDPYEIIRNRRKAEAQVVLARPSKRWNSWQSRFVCAEIENSASPTGTEKSLQENPSVHRPVFGHPIPCYSMDVDRENDCFRQERIALKSFPVSPTSG